MMVLLIFTRLSNKAIIYCISKCTVCLFVLIHIRNKNKGEVGHVRVHVSINDSDFVIFARVLFHQTSHMRSFVKIKPSRKISNLQ